MAQKVNLKEKFTHFQEYWSPHILGEVNDSYIKIAKLKGDFLWHTHEAEDELFYVVKGSLTIELESETITLTEGEFYIVPKGVPHKPSAEEEAHVLFVEAKSTVNTGNIDNDQTRTELPTL